MISGAVISMMLVATSRGQATEDVEPLNVFLFARTVGEPLSEPEKRTREKELKLKEDEAEWASKDRVEKFEAQYGKDRDDWPEDKREEYRRAQEAGTMAKVEYDYLKRGAFAKGKQHDLHDSLEDMRQAIEGKDLSRKKTWIRLVETPIEAHLVVEIWDRYGTRVAARISPGRALRSDRLGTLRLKGRITHKDKVVHAFNEHEPYWLIECLDPNRVAAAAKCLAGTIDAFIKDNYNVLVGDTTCR